MTLLFSRIFANCIIVVVTCALWACASVQSERDTDKIDKVLILIQQRLDLAPQIAKAKSRRPFELDDPAREQLVLNDAAARAATAGLDPVFVKGFFQAQLDAAKRVEGKLHFFWWERRISFSDADVPNIDQDLQPKLNRLTVQLIAALQDVVPVLAKPGSRMLLDQRAMVLIKVQTDALGPANGMQDIVADRRALEPLEQIAK